MSTPVKPIPEGYHSITPYLSIKGAAKALEFYQRAFGAEESVRMMAPDGAVVHAEIKIGDSIVMLADESPCGSKSPQSLEGTTVTIALYVEDVDASFARAVEAGATVKAPLKDQFYGDRSGSVIDPFGHLWHLMTHKEDVSPEEMKRRMAELFSQANPTPKA